MTFYYDLKSTVKRENFFLSMPGVRLKKYKPLKRPDHRWLFTLFVLNKIKELWDAVKAFYYFYLSESNKNVYSSDIRTIYEKRNLASSKKINGVYSKLKSQS